ncbi:MAG: two-component sensor histidine kinase [Deltaproteobacteria bacterium]|nr:two-component sensor histidine kinase [Deltaproteobacteria bacterium]
MENRHYYRVLTRNMVLILILISFTPLVLISGIIGYQFETSYRQKVLDHLIELVQKHQQNIDSFLNEKLSYIQVLVNSYSLEELSNESFLNHKLSILQQGYGGVFVDLGLVNAEGVQVAYAGTFKLEKANYSQAEWFKRAMKSHYFISDVFLGLRRQPHFIVAVKQQWGGKDWIVRATIDFEAFNSLVESIHIGETGSAFILNREGEFQTKPRFEPAPSKEYFLKVFARESSAGLGAPPLDIQTGADVLPMFDRHSSSESGKMMEKTILEGEVKYQNKNYIYIMTSLKGGEWLLIYQQNASDAFSELYAARKIFILIFVVGGLGIVFMTFILSRKMVRYIERADKEKEMMNEQVIEAGKLASVGELAAGIAHEINNPVAVMVEEAGWMEDLLEEEEFRGSENLDEFQRALKQIKTQGARCKEITHKLLSFARKTDPNIREVQLNDLIEDIIGISEQKARYSNVKIEKHLEKDLPPVFASPSEMQQVFLNLINNAIDAIGTGGGNISVTSRVAGDYVIVDVADTGSGIPKAMLARIFDPFFTTKPVGKGTGLGLSICYGIVKKMGGEISVNSAVGLGTTFHVHVPIPKEGESESRHQPESKTAR